MRAMKCVSCCCAVTWWLGVFAPAAEASWSTTLQEAEALRKDDRWIMALQKYDEASDLAVQSQPRPSVSDMEKVMWERAEAYDAFAHEELGSATKRAYAKMAATRWKDYVNWYETLSENDLETLGDPRSSRSRHRICKAVVFMGQALVAAGEVETMLNEYENIPKPNYLNPEAVELWKTWLHADRSFRQTPSGERTNAMRSDVIGIRPERWWTYGTFLSTWANVFYLNELTRQKYRREAEQVIEATKRN